MAGIFMRGLAISAFWILWSSPLFAASRITLAFDADWRFLKSDAAGAEKPEFSDTDWRPVTLPHDWSIEGPFDRQDPTGAAGAFLPAGVGWYRKRFSLSADQARRRVFFEFDGVMASSDVCDQRIPPGQAPLWLRKLPL
jgi:beta-galactosidase